MRYYIALAHSDRRRGFAVTFPDFPGWFANVRYFDEVRAVASKGLALLIEEMESYGEVIPEPSSFDALVASPYNQDCEALLVAGPPLPDRRALHAAPSDRFHANSNDEWPEASA